MKDINYYLNLPYTILLRRDEEGDFVARIDELPGCIAHGKNPREALKNLEQAKLLWITDCIENGDPVPEPEIEELLPSGKWVQRVPRSLHRKLVSIARRERVSLNQLVASILSEAVGFRKAAEHSTVSKVEAQDLLSAWKAQRVEVACNWSIHGPQELLVPRWLLKINIPDRVSDKLRVEEYDYEEAKAHKAKHEKLRAIPS